MEPTVVLGAITFIGSVGVWALRTEGRVNTHDKLFEERKAQDEMRSEALTYRLDRMERKMDSYFNSHRGNGG